MILRAVGWRVLCAALMTSLAACDSVPKADVQLLNVSFDPTREMYRDVNAEFAKAWFEQTGQTVSIRQSHGGSGSQARAVIEGLDADVVTLALANDIDKIQQRGKRLGADWQRRLPNNSAPHTSTIVFLVRKGNPKNIRDWDDLAREDVSVITPNPRTSGGARWNYLAAWGFELRRQLDGNLGLLEDPRASEKVAEAQAAAEAFVSKIFARVPVLDRGARAATNTFVQREIGDVLIAWENEALLSVNDVDAEHVEMVMPSASILAEPCVALVDRVVDHKGTRKAAEAYLQFLYSPAGQEIAAKHHFRPRDEAIAAKYRDDFKPVTTFTIEQAFGGWANASKTHFAEGGVFDRLYAAVSMPKS
jgi:sulfate/thiosulfate-binding protein